MREVIERQEEGECFMVGVERVEESSSMIHNPIVAVITTIT